MKADGKVKLITTCGYTHDIINEVSRTFEHYYPQCRTLALSLRGASERETCKNIFDYLVENVEYKEDKGGQYIKTPARLLSDKKGDCKSFSIFVASCLRNLNIPAVFRYVSFSNLPDPTHVYVVTKSGIIIDAVERWAGEPIFDYASNYKSKIDIDIMQPTTISRLSGVGNEDKNFADYIKMYKSGEPFIDNTIAMNWLNSEIDLHITLMQTYQNDAVTLADIMNYTDRCLVCKSLYKYTKNNNFEIKRLANVMQSLENRQMFESKSIDEHDHVAIVEQCKAMARKEMNGVYPNDFTGAIFDWVMENIAPNDKSDVEESVKRKYDKYLRESLPNGVGAVSPQQKAELENKIKGSGMYFSYAFLSEEFRSKYNIQRNYRRMERKRLQAIEIKRALAGDVSNIMNERTVNNLLLSGAIQNAKGKSCDVYIGECLESRLEKKAKVGESMTTAAIVSLIIGIISIISGILEIIFSLFGRKSVNSESVQRAKIEEFDFDSNNPNAGNSGGGNQQAGAHNSIIGGGSIPLWAIGAVFLGFLLLKKKKDEKE